MEGSKGESLFSLNSSGRVEDVFPHYLMMVFMGKER